MLLKLEILYGNIDLSALFKPKPKSIVFKSCLGMAFKAASH